MAVLANGLETLEVGATAWRLIINSNISKLYSRIEVDSIFLKQIDANSTFLTQTDANSTFLTQTDAANTFLKQTDANSTFLTQTDAANTFLKQTDAANTFLKQTDANSTFLKQSGGTLTGSLSLNGDATSAMNPITKQQFDASVTNKALLGVGTTLTATKSANYTPTMNTYNNYIITLTNSITLANPTGLVVGESGHIILIQDSTGSRTITWGSAYKFPGGNKAVLSTAANSVDTFRYFVKSTTEVHMFPSLAMS
jgi:hypothetical protein